MVSGRSTDDRNKEQQPLAGSSRASVSGSAPSSVSAISSTSFFDSPHFSRQQAYTSMPVPVSSEAPPSEHGDALPRGYRHPPPGYGAHYPPYGYPPGGHLYAPLTHGYSPHHGGPPSYSRHPHPNAYSPPPGYSGRSVYGYCGYEGSGTPLGYPTQQSREGQSKTPPFQLGLGGSGDSVSGGRSTGSGSQRASPVSEARREGASKSSQEQAAPSQKELLMQGGETSSSATSNHSPAQVSDEIETERLRQAALAEISPSQVAPIKTAFHFFVTDMRDSVRLMAEAEVRRSILAAQGEALDPYLVNSNLNCRLIKAWEDLNDDRRQACMRKEEEDRRRFMEEEEIACRHCATLTARSKSPKTPERRNISQNFSSDHQSRASPNPSPTSLATINPEPSPSPVSRLIVQQSESMDNDEKKIDDSAMITAQSHMAPDLVKTATPNDVDEGDRESCREDPEDDGANKRPSPSKLDEIGGSPIKRNRIEVSAEDNTTASS